MPRRLRVDLEGLLKAMACTSLAEEAFLDVITGTVISLRSGEHSLEEHENRFAYYKSRPARYRHIPHGSPRELYHDMLAFVAGLDDPVAQAELRRALSGKAAILRFLTAVKDFPAVAEKWETYYRRCLLERARKWLAREGFILDT
ncbi:MAG: hypothetical protein PWQ41_200 [Bacillota bacterium]|nr:hypothetical protein [Bacillota bacterium]